MKKLIYLIVLIVALGLIVPGCLPVVPPVEQNESVLLPNKSPSQNIPVMINVEGRPPLVGTITTDGASIIFDIRATGQADDGDSINPSKYYNATQFSNEYFTISVAGKFLKYNMFMGNTTPYWGTSWGDATNPLPAGVTFSQTEDGDDFVYAVSMSYAVLGISYGDTFSVQIKARDFNDDFVQSYPGYVGFDGLYSHYNGLWITDTWVFEVTLPLPDEEGPVTIDVVADPNPAPVDNTITLTATINDNNTGGSNIASAEYSLNNGVDWDSMNASDGSFNSPVEDVTVTIGSFPESQVVEILVRGTDTADNTGEPGCVLLAVYDPSAGFVTGGGWIYSEAGAYALDQSAEGKASFGFVSKYKKGATVPTGNTEFQFKAGDLNFHSYSYDWLVIAGHKAMYKGTGTINGTGIYGFMLSAIDEKLTPSTEVDMFRIKIWDKSNDTVIYDNKQDDEDGNEIGGGQIVIHKK